MQVAIDPNTVRSIHSQLVDYNRNRSQAFADIVGDYLVYAQLARDLQV
jgi:hypothetical protein